MLFVQRLLTRAAQLESVEPEELPHVRAGEDIVVGVITPEILGLYNAFLEKRREVEASCDAMLARVEELRNPAHMAEHNAIVDAHNAEHLKVRIAQETFVSEVVLGHPATREASYIGVGRKDGQIVLFIPKLPRTMNSQPGRGSRVLVIGNPAGRRVPYA